jgi:branched-subunit amino acid transport protein
MALVTALPRVLPVTLLAGRDLPPLFILWLGFIPVCILSALLAPELLLKNGELHLGIDNIFLLAAVPTVLVSWKTGSLFGAIIVGMGCVALGRFWGLG